MFLFRSRVHKKHIPNAVRIHNLNSQLNRNDCFIMEMNYIKRGNQKGCATALMINEKSNPAY
jgi:hypothetical protein